MRASTRLAIGWALSMGFATVGLAAESQVRDPSFPLFLASRANPNDFSAFATSGWDGNWYVGYNTAWVKKLPAIPPGHYARAFIGAKLGRAKLLPPEGRPPVFNPVPGSIYMAVASTPAWSSADRKLLTTTHDIPSEGSPEYPLEMTGESQWFWAEVPIQSVNLHGDNYLALWSDTPAFTSVSSAPILAAAVGGTDGGTWLINNLKGAPPATAVQPPGTPLTFFQPALALRLIPEGAAKPRPAVQLISWTSSAPGERRPVLTASVMGNSIEKAYVEFRAIRAGKAEWQPVGRPLWKAPYVFSIAQEQLPQGQVSLRVAAVDAWGNIGFSDSFTIEVSAIPIPKKK